MSAAGATLLAIVAWVASGCIVALVFGAVVRLADAEEEKADAESFGAGSAKVGAGLRGSYEHTQTHYKAHSPQDAL